ncbi:TIGR03016 family PEP-CTERM system-associated outer membrane protein [Psychrobium sp. 1_MG-2023]|uniref:TIGR03016 family PEP-CTERM system-associated outer membrane protein n=1 Tax=Psychrobium sp. 1_MG-2023 TaxID=3062624 RepID=UPI000C34CA65|nr:TIGR03016 family PEP-CTERM system-associated outer membrane protein [Psychrobium sp. 1_MG-2023]MDP2561120.1 TIGR03016 family PEP-CTERM system-associated outer membrane protein [Psychrobium sp. 1_MG-2023]PKF55096.1 TIGR03016 family PEP-CTERM system-associated outer membrane protein [Alteromonadales bacterium alter-6D02]
MVYKGMASKNPIKISVLVLFSMALPVNAELKVTPRVSMSQLYSDNLFNRSDTQQIESDNVNQLVAALALNSRSMLLDTNLSYQYTKLKYQTFHQLDQDFSNYLASTTFKLIDDQLLIKLSTQKGRFASTLTSGNSGDDILSGAAQTDITNYKINSNFNSRLGRFLDYNFNLTADKIKADQVTNAEQSLLDDTDAYSTQLTLSNGRFFKHSYWRLSARQTESERRGQGFSSLTKQKLNNYRANLGFGLTSTTSLYLQYAKEDYDVIGGGAPHLNYASYGSGIRWQPSSKTDIKLAYNWALDDNNEDHISAELAWHPSRRTSFEISTKKRFFGDAYSFSFNHRKKRIVTKVAYTEQIISYRLSSLDESPTDNLICPTLEPFTLDQCEFTSDPSPTLGAGQQLIPQQELTPDLQNNTYLDKRYTASISYQKRKLLTHFNFISSTQTNLQTDQERDQLFVGLRFNYLLSQRDSIEFSSSISQFQLEDEEQLLPRFDDTRLSLSYQRSLSPEIGVQLQLTELDRDFESNQQYKEQRIMLSLSMRF